MDDLNNVSVFDDKSNFDFTKVLYKEELKTATDLRYHGKYKGYDLITYFDTSDDTLVGTNNELNITIPDSCIKDKKDVNMMVEELKHVIDWVLDNIREYS